MVLAIASIAAVGAMQASGAGRSPEDPTERLMLRLHDLPPGYFPLDFSEGNGIEFICEDLDPSDPSTKLADFVRRFSPQGCLGLYARVYSVPGVETSGVVVGTGALDAGSGEAAEMGFSLADQLLGKVTEKGTPEEVAPTATVGDATRLFHWKRAPALFGNSHFGSFLVWRSGTVLSAVFASANSLAASDAIVASLAQRQQAHVEHPTPYTRAERNASEIGLNDPALKLPVYWLGRNFAPGHSLPVARLESGGDARYDNERLAGQKLELQYSHNVELSAWTAAGWKRFLTTRPAKEILTERCLESTKLSVSGHRTTIYTGHFEGFRPCATGSPKRFFAVVHIGGLVTTVNLDACRDCPEPVRGSFNSLAGMKTVVRSLHLRPKPAY
ncbi:MAG TPA: hypothetical protein VG816_13330 [Solirubrobacterales bacterium]|nr:hypothetical protein [Solirubrobacterales bacterium]